LGGSGHGSLLPFRALPLAAILPARDVRSRCQCSRAEGHVLGQKGCIQASAARRPTSLLGERMVVTANKACPASGYGASVWWSVRCGFGGKRRGLADGDTDPAIAATGTGSVQKPLRATATSGREERQEEATRDGRRRKSPLPAGTRRKTRGATRCAVVVELSRR
jgi:hypothetical protein